MLISSLFNIFKKKRPLAWHESFLRLTILGILISLLMLVAGNHIVLSQSNNSLNIKSDFNRDGKSDILWRHFTNGGISIWQMNGNARLSAEVFATEPDQNWKIVGTGDFNSNNNGQITLPFKSGQPWYVCQGYQGFITHQNLFAFDLSIAQDFGSSSCYPVDNNNNNKSNGQPVFAPARGKVVYVAKDLVCLLMDSNRSFLIGHIKRTVREGATVNQDDFLGTVAPASRDNGDFAHIHIEARNSTNCSPNTSVPFTAANGFQFSGVGDLPNLSDSNDYFKRALTKP